MNSLQESRLENLPCINFYVKQFNFLLLVSLSILQEYLDSLFDTNVLNF